MTCPSCIASSSARLGLGCRAVDLVGQQQLGEDRSPAELEASLPLIVEKACRLCRQAADRA